MEQHYYCYYHRRRKRRYNYLKLSIACSNPEVSMRLSKGVGGTGVSESAMNSAGAFLLRVRPRTLAFRRDGGPKSLRSPCCGLAYIKTKQNQIVRDFITFCHMRSSKYGAFKGCERNPQNSTLFHISICTP
ncbi:hypothetical protein PoB_003441600 [Plakobranchus ocellatus]|uniref:Uncharacterized protein n=1 Tax=Plakobranchus ocellatus TaxID=259542 RepID=A0AAV4AHW0_9GAST|nr:hypothetical protein PoB_003441600 [Plakobranchus ocellatus]